MKKKLTYIVLIFSFMLSLSALSGNAAISPEEIAEYKQSNNPGQGDLVIGQDESIVLGDTQIEITNPTDELTRVNLNNTHQVDIIDGSNYFEVQFYDGVSAPTPFGYSTQATSLLFAIRVATYETNTTYNVSLPGGYNITFVDIGGGNYIIRMDDFLFEIFEGIFHISNSDMDLLFERNPGGYITTTVNLTAKNSPVLFDRVDERDWFVDFNLTDPIPPGLVSYYPLDYYVPANYTIAYNTVATGGPLPAPDFGPVYDPSGVSFSFIDNSVLLMTYGEITISIFQDKVVLDYSYICITFYIWNYTIIERIVIVFMEYTIVYYLVFVELVMVIIWEIFEIKIFVEQIIIVYQTIEITIIYVSVEIYQIILIWHIQLWVIKLIFNIQVNINIVMPVRFIFIPVIVPIFVPLIYYIPVYINNYVHIYVPYAAAQVFIDVYDEQLQMPNHTIQYFVFDQAGDPINDATVSINYNGSDYPATFQSNGIYEVELPASTEQEQITVTATKQWYPTATLVYDLNITWVTNTVTAASPLPIIAAIAALCFVATVGLVYKRRKK